MKKRYLLLIVALLIMATLCACGNSGKNEDPNANKIAITTEFMEEELAEAVALKIDAEILRIMNDAASKRKGVSDGWETEVKFTDYETTEVKLEDDYNIRVYGKVYGKTVYGDAATGTFSLKVWCEKDEEREKGYTIRVDWGLNSKLIIE